MSAADRAKQALRRAGISDAEIARRLSITPQAVSGWWKTGRISNESLTGIAKATGSTLDHLIAGEDQDPALAIPRFSRSSFAMSAHESSTARDNSDAEVVRSVPIIGFAIANPGEDGYFDDMGLPVGGGEGYLPWPTKDPNAFALRVKGDSMQPRIRPGELIVVEPNRAVSAGDDVVVRCRDGRKMVKQLLIRRDGEITLGSINQAHPQVTLSLEDIESIQFVSAIVPRSAFVKEGT